MESADAKGIASSNSKSFANNIEEETEEFQFDSPFKSFRKKKNKINFNMDTDFMNNFIFNKSYNNYIK